MTEPDDSAPQVPKDPPFNFAHDRETDIAVLFDEMHQLMKAWRTAETQASKASGQKIVSKLSELQTVHLLLLRAEEAFHDKFSQEPVKHGADYDIIRSDLGRALDRIRDTLGTDSIPEGPDSDGT